MALQNAFGDISLEATQLQIKVLSQQIADMADSINTLVQFLYANSPRVDVAGRLAVNGSEVTQTVTGTVTAVVSGQPQQFQGQDVPLHIYDNIKVT